MENQLVPVDVKKRSSIVRFIRNGATLVASAIATKGFKKLSSADTNLLISIINGNLIAYNEKNGHPLSEEDIEEIQKRFNNLDIYSFKGESWYYKIKNDIIEKVKNKKLAGRDLRGFVFTPTGVLMINEEDWGKYKTGIENNPEALDEKFIKVITHEGFHFLTNQKDNNMNKIGEKLTSEGADESFIVKTFNNGSASRVIPTSGRTGLTHFNFYSDSPYAYSAAVSIMNMLGTMVRITPEVSALKNDGKFIDAVKERYGEAFYKRLAKVTNYMLNSEVPNRDKNEALYHKLVQNFVLKAIRDDIVENSTNPQDAVRRLRDFQKAEYWSARILLTPDNRPKRKIAKKKYKLEIARKAQKFAGNIKEISTNLSKKKINEQPVRYTFVPDMSFGFYYTQAYTRVIDRLKQRGYLDVERELQQCRYKPVRFNSFLPINLENSPGGERRYTTRISNLLKFCKEYYRAEKEEVVSKEQYVLYRSYLDKQKQEREQQEDKKEKKNPWQVRESQQRPQSRQIRPVKQIKPNRSNRNDGPEIGD